MKSKINEILKNIEALQKELKGEYEELLKKYGYKYEKNRIVFLESIRASNKKLKENLFTYVITADFKHLLSMPFIYGMIVPMVFLDVSLWIYQTFAFPLYGIPKVRRKDFIIYDRKYLDYLNFIQKVNCLYCSYGNGLFAYAVEVAARTERFWCPIKAARNPKYIHKYYPEFADYGDPEGFFEVFNQTECFNKSKDEPENK